jgi:hypothetical protein
LSEPSSGKPPLQPIWLGRSLGIAFGALVALFSGGCSILFLFQGGAAFAAFVVPIGGIPLAIGLAILRSAFVWPYYTPSEPLSATRWVIVVLGVAVMIFGGIGILSTFGLWRGVLENGVGVVGYPLFLVGLVTWWLAIRVGR